MAAKPTCVIKSRIHWKRVADPSLLFLPSSSSSLQNRIGNNLSRYQIRTQTRSYHNQFHQSGLKGEKATSNRQDKRSKQLHNHRYFIMTIEDNSNIDEYDEDEVEETTTHTDHDDVDEHPHPKPKKKKSTKKKKSKKLVTEDDHDGEEEFHDVPIKPKKKKSKKKLEPVQQHHHHHHHVDDEDMEEEEEEDTPRPKKKKSIKKKKSKNGSSLMDIEAQVVAVPEDASGIESGLTIPTAISTTGHSHQSGFDRRKTSMLASSDDPFALREGKTLLWRNVNMTLVSFHLF
jgi:hypothetical protein